MAKLTVAEFTRKIQRLAHHPSPSKEEEMELRFYFQVVKKMSEIDICNLVPLDIACPIEDARKWAIPLGMNVVKGGSGNIYLSWSKGLDEH